MKNMQNGSVPFETHLAAKIVDIHQLIADSERLRIYSKYYTEKYSIKDLIGHAQEHGPQTFESPDAIAMHCIPQTMVIMYARMFDKTSKRKPKPYTLDKGIFRTQESLEENHRQIIDQRNKYFAHDENYLDILPKFHLEVRDNDIKVKTPQEWVQILNCPNMEYNILEPILDVIDNFLDDKLTETVNLFQSREVDLIYYNIDSINEKLKRNSPITDKDVKRWNHT